MELNTGVLAFNKRSKVIKTFKAWSKIYANRKEIDFHDQTSLSLAMLGRGLALFPLPVDYNFRANQGQLLFGEVKIIHARLRDYQLIKKRANKHSGFIRYWFPRIKVAFKVGMLHSVARLKQLISLRIFRL